MKEGFVESQGVKIHYIAGVLEPEKMSLLFVPGVMMPAWIWDKQLEYFSKDYNVVAMEPRSQGDSDQTTEGHYAHAMAKDIQAVVDTLNLQRLVLIGWSIGVPQVVNYTVHFDSGKLMGLVLVDGIVGANSNFSFYQSMVNYWSQFQMDRILSTEKFVKDIFRQNHQKSYLEKLKEVAMRTPTNTVMTLISNYILQDCHPLLQRICVPAFVATVEGPRLDYMQEMHKKMNNSHLEIFSSAGHALFVDQPEEFNRSLEAFIRVIS